MILATGVWLQPVSDDAGGGMRHWPSPTVTSGLLAATMMIGTSQHAASQMPEAFGQVFQEVLRHAAQEALRRGGASGSPSVANTGTTNLRLSGNNRWLVFASRRTANEALDLARSYADRFPNVSVMQSINGWYAVVSGPMNVPDPRSAAEALLRSGGVPSDIQFSSGDNWVAQIALPTQNTLTVTKPTSSKSEPTQAKTAEQVFADIETARLASARAAGELAKAEAQAKQIADAKAVQAAAKRDADARAAEERIRAEAEAKRIEETRAADQRNKGEVEPKHVVDMKAAMERFEAIEKARKEADSKAVEEQSQVAAEVQRIAVAKETQERAKATREQQTGERLPKDELNSAGSYTSSKKSESSPFFNGVWQLTKENYCKQDQQYMVVLNGKTALCDTPKGSVLERCFDFQDESPSRKTGLNTFETVNAPFIYSSRYDEAARAIIYFDIKTIDEAEAVKRAGSKAKVAEYISHILATPFKYCSSNWAVQRLSREIAESDKDGKPVTITIDGIRNTLKSCDALVASQRGMGGSRLTDATLQRGSNKFNRVYPSSVWSSYTVDDDYIINMEYVDSADNRSAFACFVGHKSGQADFVKPSTGASWMVR